MCLFVFEPIFVHICRTFAWELSSYMWIIWKQVSRGTCVRWILGKVIFEPQLFGLIVLRFLRGVCNNLLHSQLTLSLLVQLGKTNRRSCAQFVICQTGRTVFRQSLDDGETNGANKRKHLGVCCQQGRVSLTRGALLSLFVREARSSRLDSLD